MPKNYLCCYLKIFCWTNVQFVGPLLPYVSDNSVDSKPVWIHRRLYSFVACALIPRAISASWDWASNPEFLVSECVSTNQLCLTNVVPFCGTTGMPCFRFCVTLPLSFEARVDQSSIAWTVLLLPWNYPRIRLLFLNSLRT